jgi:hypothetical protein
METKDLEKYTKLTKKEINRLQKEKNKNVIIQKDVKNT